MQHDPSVNANYSKACILGYRVINRLDSLYPGSFPTRQTGTACSFLKETIKAILDSPNLEDKDSVDVHGFVTSVHQIVEWLEESCNGRISWPATYFCDDIWAKLFPSGSPKLFYVHAPEYNYFVQPFAAAVVHELENVLDETAGDVLEKKYPLWTLASPSIEDRNLPLYANIVHEFGHVLFHDIVSDLEALWASSFESINAKLAATFGIKPTLDDTRKGQRVEYILRALAQEAFSDLLATLVMGPAFYLSLYETLWPSERSVWTADLTETVWDISAHPAPSFRLATIWRKANVETFIRNVLTRVATDGTDTIAPVIRAFELPIHTLEPGRFVAAPEDDIDEPFISKLLTQHVKEIGGSLSQFTDGVEKLLRGRYTSVIVTINAEDVCSLIERLQNRVTPNIIPNDTLLGRPAGIAEILAAAAAYRLHFLTTRTRPLSQMDVQDLDRIERLTAKAIESTFIQMRYNEARGAAPSV